MPESVPIDRSNESTKLLQNEGVVVEATEEAEGAVRFGLISEADTPKGMTHYHRYHELLDEVCFAEQVGFDFWGTSEQHFLYSIAPISAPETFYAVVAERTSRIKIRHMSILMLAFNHPIRIAERLATLDILSHGRVELCTARSNSAYTLDPFGIEAGETRAQWRETLEVVVKALTDDVLEHDGKYWKITPTRLTPRLYRRELFPVSVICSSKGTHTVAGKAGLGAITGDNYLGWEYIEECARLYKDAIRHPEPFAAYPVTNSLGFFVSTANCATTQEKAIESARHVAEGFFSICLHLFEELAARSPDYADLSMIRKLADKRHDLRFLMDYTPTLLLGTPDDFIEKIKRLETMGIGEVVLRIDGFGHEQNKKAIELVGKYVIPEFLKPESIVGSKQIPQQYEELGVENTPRYLT